MGPFAASAVCAEKSAARVMTRKERKSFEYILGTVFLWATVVEVGG